MEQKVKNSFWKGYPLIYIDFRWGYSEAFIRLCRFEASLSSGQQKLQLRSCARPKRLDLSRTQGRRLWQPLAVPMDQSGPIEALASRTNGRAVGACRSARNERGCYMSGQLPKEAAVSLEQA